ncbi:MAG: DeoR family transcriptional regulator [Candidatus Nanoarchaeia archaeon]|nr:DeoR family transcriptional regulator [Candidatus Nanoarchaeia archaeon]
MSYEEAEEQKQKKTEIHLHQSDLGSLFSHISKQLSLMDEKQKMLMEGQINMIEHQIMTISALKKHDEKINTNVSNVNKNVLSGFEALENLSNLKNKVEKEFKSELGKQMLEILNQKKEMTTSEIIEAFKKYASRATIFRTLSELTERNLVERVHGKILIKN